MGETQELNPLAEYAELIKRRAELKEEDAALIKKQRYLEDLCEKKLAELGSDHIRVNGVLIYTAKELWVKVADGCMEGLIEAFETNKLDGMIKDRTVNVQTLSAYVREQRNAGNDIPSEILSQIEITEGTRVKARKG